MAGLPMNLPLGLILVSISSVTLKLVLGQGNKNTLDFHQKIHMLEFTKLNRTIYVYVVLLSFFQINLCPSSFTG